MNLLPAAQNRAVLAGVKAKPYRAGLRPGLDPGCGRHTIAAIGSRSTNLRSLRFQGIAGSPLSIAV
jgi:hypothetical protein